MFCNFWKLPFDAGDRVYIKTDSGEFVEAEIQSVTVRSKEDNEPVTYHARGLITPYRDTKFDFTINDVGVTVWKDLKTAKESAGENSD